MKKRRILITLDLCYGLNVMLYECGLTKQQISIDSPALKGLSLREFCMLTKEKILSAEGLTPNELSFIERLLGEYSLRLGMPDIELEAYLNQYYRENPEEKEFYDLCDRICGITPNTDSANRSERDAGFRRREIQARDGQTASQQPYEREKTRRFGLVTLPKRAKGLFMPALVYEVVLFSQSTNEKGYQRGFLHI